MPRVKKTEVVNEEVVEAVADAAEETSEVEVAKKEKVVDEENSANVQDLAEASKETESSRLSNQDIDGIEMKLDPGVAAEPVDLSADDGDQESSTPRRRRRKKEDFTPDEQVGYASAFFSMGAKVANRDRRAELREDEYVVTEQGDLEIETRAKIRAREYKELAGSAKNGRVLEGEIIGMRHTDPNDLTSILMADVWYGQGTIQVCIPSFLLFDYDEDKYEGDTGARALEEIIKQRINSRVRFVVRQVNQDTGIAYADALEAQQQLGFTYYKHLWMSSTKPRIREGMKVKARVVSVSRRSMVVNVLGPETTIIGEDLSYLRNFDAREKYQVDDDVIVRIKEIKEETVTKRANKYDLIKIVASIRDAEPDERKIFFDGLRVGDMKSAVVTGIDDVGHVFLSLQDKLECMCDYPRFGVKPMLGQKRVVRITGKDPEKMHILASFIR